MERAKHRHLLALIVSVGMLGACSGGHGDRAEGSGTLTIKGSDTMVILTQRWAETYMREHPGTTIQVSGGGSGTGIAALMNGTTDIATSSRPLQDAERSRLHGNAHETRVALDAIAIYVHEDNQMRSLTMEQLAQVFRGRITNWSAIGGPDAPIVLYSRENNSGTYAYFKEHVLDDQDFAQTAQTLAGTAAVISAVSRDPNGIGYGGIGYARGVRTVPIASEGEPVAPTLENATSGAYPLARYLFMYTNGEPTGTARDFLTWIVSDEGQGLVDDIGFYPLPREQVSEAR